MSEEDREGAEEDGRGTGRGVRGEVRTGRLMGSV